jgi:hypothetical protein
VGTGGMAGMTSALAGDPAKVDLHGTVVDSAGAPLGGVHLVISEELPPDGGLAAFKVTTAADGSFGASVYAWGTANAPATLTIATPADEAVDVIGQTCSQTWGVVVAANHQLALADATPDPLTLIATTTLLGEACGATGTPPPDSREANVGRADLTPPPTDASVATIVNAPDRLGPALTIGFVIGLVAAAAVLLPRRGARRRD